MELSEGGREEQRKPVGKCSWCFSPVVFVVCDCAVVRACASHVPQE